MSEMITLEEFLEDPAVLTDLIGKSVDEVPEIFKNEPNVEFVNAAMVELEDAIIMVGVQRKEAPNKPKNKPKNHNLRILK